LPSTIEKVHQQHRDAGLVVLPISIEEGRSKVGAWTQKHTLTLPFLLDPAGDVTAAYRVTATPTVFLIGRDGKLVAKALGTKEWTSERGHALFRRLLQR
jgi:peroxiredoxin